MTTHPSASDVMQRAEKAVAALQTEKELRALYYREDPVTASELAAIIARHFEDAQLIIDTAKMPVRREPTTPAEYCEAIISAAQDCDAKSVLHFAIGWAALAATAPKSLSTEGLKPEGK